MQKDDNRYLAPKIVVIELNQNDVIITSPGTNNGADGDQGDGNWWEED
ncbi:MAG: hypothetical protein IJY84_01245 [Clostridia bacterium]|nr:hypothetical protein [Clostridia bacterium]